MMIFNHVDAEGCSHQVPLGLGFALDVAFGSCHGRRHFDAHAESRDVDWFSTHHFL